MPHYYVFKYVYIFFWYESDPPAACIYSVARDTTFFYLSSYM